MSELGSTSAFSSDFDPDYNPFTIPNDGHIFNNRVLKEKNNIKNTPVHQRIRPKDITITKEVKNNIPSSVQNIINAKRTRTRENLSDFIAKKRDMFLVQMSLDTKKAEIQKLEKKASLKEEALKRSELMLEQDAIRFDKFLKANDKNAHDAIKRQEQESKERQEKVNEYKKLTADRAKIEADISKISEQLQACTSYKQFLDNLIPEDWKKEQVRIAEIKAFNDKNNPDRDLFDDEENPEPMYFKVPEQLLQIYADLETRNLFLIQNCQVTEESLEELKQKFAETETSLSEKNRQSNGEILALKQKIAAYEDKANTLRRLASGNNSGADNSNSLDDLTHTIKSVWQRCSLSNDHSSSSPLDMLGEIERHLESLLTAAANMDPDYREKAEQEKEEERRRRVRKERKIEQDRQYEERMMRTKQRATVSPVKKQVGKPVMFRSAPLSKKKELLSEGNKQKNEEDELIKKFFS